MDEQLPLFIVATELSTHFRRRLNGSLHQGKFSNWYESLDEFAQTQLCREIPNYLLRSKYTPGNIGAREIVDKSDLYTPTSILMSEGHAISDTPHFAYLQDSRSKTEQLFVSTTDLSLSLGTAVNGHFLSAYPKKLANLREQLDHTGAISKGPPLVYLTAIECFDNLAPLLYGALRE